MKRRNQTDRQRRPGPGFKIEHLEQRQLMAADLTTSPISVGPIMSDDDVPAALTSALTSADAVNAEPIAFLVDTIVIPVTTVDPRSFDGTGNNLVNPDWGSAGEQLLRVAEADYGDGISSLAGELRPTAREVSNALAAQEEGTAGNERALSAFIYAWGQFIDHDIDLTKFGTDDPEVANIEVPTDDPEFDPDGTGTQVIPFIRSLFDPTTGDSVDNPRQQINEITAWIDGSTVYGSDQATADSLRTFVGGKLRTSEGDLPPTDAEGNFMAGDERANENVELTSMHTLFIREHNWWAEQIAQQDPSLSDEQIFQQARSIVIAEIQAITFNEFLPALLGVGAIDAYQGYAPSVDPSVANEFSTAAFRLHTLINDDVEFFGNDGRAVGEEIELAEAFNNPDLLRETGADSILKYLASTQSQEVDNQIVDSLRNFLFGEPGQGGLDLASLNVQRGRDHGLADYNSVREAYGLARVGSFVDISSDPEIQQKLQSLYDSVDDIDLWVGLLAEDHVPGSSVGETAQTIISDQFERLRDGDRFWYENIFSGRALQQIDSTTLADVIARNTTIDNLQDNVFFMQAEVTGRVFVDGNSNGRQDRREQALANVAVELLDSEGDVVATTVTNARGRYRFDTFRETGDYQVRIVVPSRFRATTGAATDLLISRGDETLSGVNFGLSMLRDMVPNRPGDRNKPPRPQRLAAVDAALTDNGISDVVAEVTRMGRPQGGRRGRPR